MSDFLKDMDESRHDDAVRGDHYQANINGAPVDVFDIARAYCLQDPEQITALRYVLRAGKKGNKPEQISKAIKCCERWLENELKHGNQ